MTRIEGHSYGINAALTSRLAHKVVGQTTELRFNTPMLISLISELDLLHSGIRQEYGSFSIGEDKVEIFTPRNPNLTYGGDQAILYETSVTIFQKVPNGVDEYVRIHIVRPQKDDSPVSLTVGIANHTPEKEREIYGDYKPETYSPIRKIKIFRNGELGEKPPTLAGSSTPLSYSKNILSNSVLNSHATRAFLLLNEILHGNTEIPPFGSALLGNNGRIQRGLLDGIKNARQIKR